MLFSKLSLDGHSWAVVALFFSSFYAVGAQLTPEEWEPLLDGLKNPPIPGLAERVPLMTNDSVKIPLIDLQVYAPPSSGQMEHEKGCTRGLLDHSFGLNSFGAPVVVDYAPPTDLQCGEVGKWAGISLNLTVHWSVCIHPCLVLLSKRTDLKPSISAWY
jgi:hypothetical protein